MQACLKDKNQRSILFTSYISTNLLLHMYPSKKKQRNICNKLSQENKLPV